MALVLLAALALCTVSLTTTNYIDPLNYSAQHILSQRDSLWFNLAVTFAAIVLLRLVWYVRVPDRFVRWASAVCLMLLAAAGAAWVVLAKAVPMSDQGVLYESACAIVNGDFSALQDTGSYEFFYFVRFPFQFGFLSYLELLVRVFGERGTLIVGPVLNVLMLISGYAAILLTTRRLFGDNRVTLLTLLFLCACVQPLLACSLLYGLIPALACSMWGILFAVRFLQTGRKREILWAALLCALAVYMKPNAWIFAAAIAATLVLHAIRARGWTPVLAAAAVLLACVPLPKLAQASYESRIGVSFGAGYPMASWMAMGMQESWMACGWYNGYSKEMYYTYGMDVDACRERNIEDIEASLKLFRSDPAYTYWFYQEKFASQWNEPTFESVWASCVCESYGERPKIVTSMSDGRWPGVLYEKATNYSVQLLYTGFLLSACVLLRRRKTEQLIYPIAILGGILFHLLFEANAKYALSYAPLFCPLAAYGILLFGNGLRERALGMLRRGKAARQ